MAAVRTTAPRSQTSLIGTGVHQRPLHTKGPRGPAPWPLRPQASPLWGERRGDGPAVWGRGRAVGIVRPPLLGALRCIGRPRRGGHRGRARPCGEPGRVGGSLPPPRPAPPPGRGLRLYPPEALQWQRQRMVSLPHIHGRLADHRIDADYPAVGHRGLRPPTHLMAPRRPGCARQNFDDVARLHRGLGHDLSQKRHHGRGETVTSCDSFSAAASWARSWPISSAWSRVSACRLDRGEGRCQDGSGVLAERLGPLGFREGGTGTALS
jgi:hypothetical protein